MRLNCKYELAWDGCCTFGAGPRGCFGSIAPGSMFDVLLSTILICEQGKDLCVWSCA